MNTRFRFSLFFLLTLTACNKEDLHDLPLFYEEIVIGSSKNRPGLGDNDEVPLGNALRLPEGIRIVKRPHQKFDPDITKLHAHANAFYVDISLVNDRMPGTPSVYVELPPGLIVVSMDHDKQNGISIGKYLVAVPPTERVDGGGRDTTTIYVGMLCINKNRSMPWYDNQTEEQRYPISRNNYEQFLITTDSNLLQFLEVVANKPGLKVTQHWDPVEAHEADYIMPEWFKIYDYLNEMIWKITDGRGITIDELKKLKDALKDYE